MSGALELSRPLVLLALLAVPLYAWLRLRIVRRDRVVHAPLQYRTAAHRRRRGARLWLAVELLLVVVLIVAFAGPHRETRLELMDEEGADVMLALDVSLSMLAEDFPPNRLEALRRIAGDFIARSGNHRVGILIFGKDVYVQSPLTTDDHALRQLLASVTVHAIDQAKSGGTAVGDALLVAAERLQAARIEGRGQAIVLITDGESNMGADPVTAARYAAHLDIRLHAIGVGGDKPVEVFFEGRRVGGDDPYFAYLDDTELKSVAAAADGSYYRASDVGALEEVFVHLSRLESAPIEVRTVGIRRFYVSYLALVALPLFIGYLFLRGVLLRRPFR